MRLGLLRFGVQMTRKDSSPAACAILPPFLGPGTRWSRWSWSRWLVGEVWNRLGLPPLCGIVSSFGPPKILAH